ncbi:biotin carboxylase [Paeniglutamicibacter antarcticus]|uniref:biotin carboxylase n=1 Tax=Paeniglutamicibacter antarcticus TaxID=494023 RepID=UPI0031EBF6CF
MPERATDASKEVVQPAKTNKTLAAKSAAMKEPAGKKPEPAKTAKGKKTATASTPKAKAPAPRKSVPATTAPKSKTAAAATKPAEAKKTAAPTSPETMAAPASTPSVAPDPTATEPAATEPVMPRATPTGPEAPEATIGTDAAFATEAPPTAVQHTVRNISELRHFFRTNNVPIFFIGATPFNLLGLDRWVRNFSYISYYDSWDGAHPRVFTPVNKPYVEFESGEDINNWLLLNAEVRARMNLNVRPGVRPKVAMVFFNEETERICRELGYDLILPAAELRHRLDSKMVTTKLGNDFGVPSVPNVLSKGSTYAALRADADAASLGKNLVVQTPYGDSGKTTFFISNEAEWDNHCEDIIGDDIKVMRRIKNLPVAVEAVLTRSGTLVGPFLTELAGYSELTPYPGGWCGNEMHPEVLSATQRTRAMELVKAMGDGLSSEGYRGFFEVDVLVDLDTDEVYLGELNPRISGASAITNVTAGAYADVPLFLFHLLEYMDVEFELDIDEITERWEALSGADVWSQMIIKENSDVVQQLTQTPATGQYYLDSSGAMVFNRAALDWHMLQNESEAFFLRIHGPGDYRWHGSDLGVLVTKGRLQVEEGGVSKLNIRAKHFIDCLRAGFDGVPLDEDGLAIFTPGPGVKSQW